MLDPEVGRRDLTDLWIVTSMRERKALMHDLSDAVVVLPGGLGTFEELFAVLTWAQLGLYAKPIVVVGIAGYFTPFVNMLDHDLEYGFLTAADRRLVTVVDDVHCALAALGIVE